MISGQLDRCRRYKTDPAMLAISIMGPTLRDVKRSTNHVLSTRINASCQDKLKSQVSPVDISLG